MNHFAVHLKLVQCFKSTILHSKIQQDLKNISSAPNLLIVWLVRWKGISL